MLNDFILAYQESQMRRYLGTTSESDRKDNMASG